MCSGKVNATALMTYPIAGFGAKSIDESL